MSIQVPTVKLNDGSTIPIVGFGTWKSTTGEAQQVIVDAVNVGYRHIDCAAFYGNEKEVGEGLKHVLDSGVVERKDLYVCSKLWNSHHGKHVRDACLKTLKDLQLDYLDLYMIQYVQLLLCSFSELLTVAVGLLHSSSTDLISHNRAIG